MVEINSLDDYRAVQVVGLQPDDRLPNDYLRMVARVFAAYREEPLRQSVVAYIDGFGITSLETADQFVFRIQPGACFIDDQFIGVTDEMEIREDKIKFAVDNTYSLVMHYEWINITPPTVPTIQFVQTSGIDQEHMLELLRFDISLTGEFIVHPQDLTGLYMKNFVRLFELIEANILENTDILKFSHIVVPEESIDPSATSGDFVYFDWASASYKPARACTKRFDKGIGLLLRNKSTGAYYLIFNGIIKIDPNKYDIPQSRINLVNLEAGSSYFLEDGCTQSGDYIEHEEYTELAGFPATGIDGMYYVDGSDGAIYEWDSVNTVYVLADPVPVLDQSRGKITPRFYPSTVRVGFAIDHNTLSIDMDYSSEINIMNIMELFGDSTLFAKHYDAYRSYFEILRKIDKFSSTSDANGLRISEISGEIAILEGDKTTKAGEVSTRETSYINSTFVPTTTDALSATRIASTVNIRSKVEADPIMWSLFAQELDYYRTASQSVLIDAYNNRVELDALGDALAATILYNPVKAAIAELINNLTACQNVLLNNTSPIDLGFSELLFITTINGSLPALISDASTVEINQIRDRFNIWVTNMTPYIYYPDRDQVTSNPFISEDVQNVIKELEFARQSTLTQFMPAATYDSIKAALDKVIPLNYKLWKMVKYMYDVLNSSAVDFVTNSSIYTAAADITQSDTLQATVDDYIVERTTYYNGVYTLRELYETALYEYNTIQDSIDKLTRESIFLSNKNSEINLTTVPTLEADKAALEQAETGIIADIEQEKPIKSIFYLSNFERIQYNYTYLTIRIRHKYTVYDSVVSNIGKIEENLNLLLAEPYPDQTLISELTRLRSSYIAVRDQLDVEIESMIMEYNRIRTESYGLAPIAHGDRDFTDGDGTGASYANPDLPCMAITE